MFEIQIENFTRYYRTFMLLLYRIIYADTTVQSEPHMTQLSLSFIGFATYDLRQRESRENVRIKDRKKAEFNANEILNLHR